jgi:hypothetical protein
MIIHDCFGTDYTDARARFLAAARAAGATLTTWQHPLRGPAKERLFTDLAWVGPADAARVFVTMSATHGVEGFCGSGCQVASFGALAAALPPDAALAQIHAINPHGFAWLRRVNEDNVDLNRNFVPHGTAPYPVNAGYDELADAIVPAEWSGPVRAAADARLAAYSQQNGPAKLQWALSGGQYNHPHGIFFGGNAPTWSNRLLIRIVREHLSRARAIGLIDYHTGLGPYGTGEIIAALPLGSESARLTRDILGREVTSPDDGSSTSAPLTGVNQPAMAALLGGTAFIGCALEYGTYPVPTVLEAVRSDAWLHAHGTLDDPAGRAIKAEIRRTFYPDADDWRRMVWGRAEEVSRRLLAGLARL